MFDPYKHIICKTCEPQGQGHFGVQFYSLNILVKEHKAMLQESCFHIIISYKLLGIVDDGRYISVTIITEMLQLQYG